MRSFQRRVLMLHLFAAGELRYGGRVHLEVTGLHRTGSLVTGDRHPSRRDLGVHQLEGSGLRALAEQLLALTENDWKRVCRDLIDQTLREQGLNQVAAPLRNQW